MQRKRQGRALVSATGRHQKALKAQIRQLIELNRQPRDGGDVAFSFKDGRTLPSCCHQATSGPSRRRTPGDRGSAINAIGTDRGRTEDPAA